MKNENDDAQSSGILVPKKEFSNSFDGAHIKIVIIGGNVFEKSDKSVKEVMDETHEDEAPQPVRSVVNPFVITREKLARGIKAVKDYFWGNSCFSIIYCALRDEFDYTPVKSDFEYDMRIIADELHLTYTCPKNTIASTFSYNRDMKLHISKWEGRGMKSRCYNLAKDFIDAIYNDEE